ncbi:MAG: hypothetical protein NTZ67_03955 [Gammaproteobacteria bacterium]|nr:hypothetical protein [Gammaproteobacteria bacterium]
MKKNSVGIAMVEVLISMGLISLVLLSLLSYQISALKSIESSNFNNIAMTQLINFSEMLWINKTDGARNRFLSSWNKDNQNLLPEGEGNFIETDDHQCTITINWFFKKKMALSEQVFC